MSAIGRAANLVSAADFFIFRIISLPTFTFLSRRHSSLCAPNRGSRHFPDLFHEGLYEQYDATTVNMAVHPSICLLVHALLPIGVPTHETVCPTSCSSIPCQSLMSSSHALWRLSLTDLPSVLSNIRTRQ